jgi:protein-tyrosine phosphatase
VGPVPGVDDGTRPGTQVLAVCTGNVCRSPATERLLSARLGAAAGVSVASAGTSALVGDPVDPPMADLIRAAGGDPDRFTARQLLPADLRVADLVIVMTRQHRSAVVNSCPAAVRRTFLLPEIAALAGAVAAAGWPAGAADPAARLAALPRLVAAHRSGLAGRTDLEVADPYRRPGEAYADAAAAISAAVDQLVRAVT